MRNALKWAQIKIARKEMAHLWGITLGENEEDSNLFNADSRDALFS